VKKTLEEPKSGALYPGEKKASPEPKCRRACARKQLSRGEAGLDVNGTGWYISPDRT